VLVLRPGQHVLDGGMKTNLLLVVNGYSGASVLYAFCATGPSRTGSKTRWFIGREKTLRETAAREFPGCELEVRTDGEVVAA
jgi:hypothetical protein